MMILRVIRRILSSLNINSLFARLLFSFLFIIFIVLSFNFLSFTYFKTSIHEETIKYNTANLNSTAKNFEEYFDLINKTMISLYLNDEYERLNIAYIQNDSLDYSQSSKVINVISNAILDESMKYVHNLVLYMEKPDQTLSNEGINTPENFLRFYSNQTYNADFWRNQINNEKEVTIYPSRLFILKTQHKYLIPIIVRNAFQNNSYWAALIDSEKMFQNLHQSINENLIILTPQGTKIFSSQEDVVETPYDFTAITEQQEGYFQLNDFYYFFKRAPGTGFTYINIIPNENVTSKIKQLELILIIIFIICVVLSTVISILLSFRFNRPIKKIIETIQKSKEYDPTYKSSIREFDLIGDNLRNMIKTNTDITKVIEKKDSLLRNYAFTNRLKNIHTNLHEIKELSAVNKRFRFIFFEITFRVEHSEDQRRTVNIIREFINQYWLEIYNDAITFQIEKAQIVTLLMESNDNSLQNKNILNAIENLKKIFDLDLDEIFYTICISPIYTHSNDLNKAYNEVQIMSKQRILNDQTQIITEFRPELPSFILTPNQEQEFRVHLIEGNESAVNHWLQKQLNYMHKKSASAVQYKDFAKDIFNKVRQALYSLQLQQDSTDKHIRIIENCHTFDTYQEAFKSFLGEITSLIHNKKNEHDHITTFVSDYFEEHYSEDISLDIMGDKLNITGGYLSSYFKEKTGMNFSEYLNALRMDKAKQFLQNTDMKIHEIAEKVGYFNVNSFIRMFKKINGLTPGEYRKNNFNQDDI